MPEKRLHLVTKNNGQFQYIFVYLLSYLAGYFARLNVLSDKFNYDSSVFIRGLYSPSETQYLLNENYQFSINLFRLLGLHHLSVNLLYMVCFTVGLIAILGALRDVYGKISNGVSVLFVIAVFGFLLPVYVAPLSKDIIFLIIVAALINLRSRFLQLVTLIVMAFVAINIRSGYVLIPVTLGLAYLFQRSSHLNTFKFRSWILLYCCFIFTFIVISGQTRTPYYRFRNALNDYRIGSADARTIFPNYFDSSLVLLNFLVDTLTNFFSFLAPVYLLSISVSFFVPMVVMTMFWFLYFNSVKQIALKDSPVKLFFLIPIPFLFLASIGEPDFGSFLRHLTVFMPHALLSIAVPAKTVMELRMAQTRKGFYSDGELFNLFRR